MATVDYPNIEHTPDGVPVLAGTRTKVIEVVLDRLAHHWDAEEIQRQHPHLRLAQIYSALAYYHDHHAHQFAITVGQAINDLELLAAVAEPEDLRDRIEFIPL